MRKIVVLCAQSALSVGWQLVETLRELQANVEMTRVPWRRFPDGEPDLILDRPRDLDNAHVVFVADFSADSGSIMEQIAVLYAMQHYGAFSLTVLIPYFPGTLDRVDVPGRIVWSKTLARMLSQIPPCFGAGPARIVICDIHARQTELVFGDGVANVFLDVLRGRESGVFRDIWGLLASWPGANTSSPMVCFPDQGAAKRYGHLGEAIVCEKQRGSGDTRMLRIVEGNPGGRIVLIVDDLVMSGSTLLETAKLMRERGAKHVYSLVVHGVLPDDAVQRINASTHLDALYVTDTIPRVREIAGDRIKVVSIVPQLARWLVDHLD